MWAAHPKLATTAVVAVCFAVLAVAVGVIGLVVVDGRATEPAGDARIGACTGGRIDPDDGSRNWTCTVQYRYLGETFSSTLRRSSSRTPTGTVRVFVDPKDPSVSTFGFSATSKLRVVRGSLVAGLVLLGASGGTLVALKLRSR